MNPFLPDSWSCEMMSSHAWVSCRGALVSTGGLRTWRAAGDGARTRCLPSCGASRNSPALPCLTLACAPRLSSCFASSCGSLPQDSRSSFAARVSRMCSAAACCTTCGSPSSEVESGRRRVSRSRHRSRTSESPQADLFGLSCRRDPAARSNPSPSRARWSHPHSCLARAPSQTTVTVSNRITAITRAVTVDGVTVTPVGNTPAGTVTVTVTVTVTHGKWDLRTVAVKVDFQSC